MVSCCGFASGEIGLLLGLSSFATHTHSYGHIYTITLLFPSIPALCSHSVSGVQKAAGLIKWKWPIITKAMTAAVGRHQTMAYLWRCVSGAVLYCTLLLFF